VHLRENSGYAYAPKTGNFPPNVTLCREWFSLRGISQNGYTLIKQRCLFEHYYRRYTLNADHRPVDVKLVDLVITTITIAIIIVVVVIIIIVIIRTQCTSQLNWQSMQLAYI